MGFGGFSWKRAIGVTSAKKKNCKSNGDTYDQSWEKAKGPKRDVESAIRANKKEKIKPAPCGAGGRSI